jgi:hypothetical protein
MRCPVDVVLPCLDEAQALPGVLGIGGDPVALLRRTVSLIGQSGTVLVEPDATEPGLWQRLARLRWEQPAGRTRTSNPFPRAAAGVAALPGIARGAGLRPSLL